MEVVIASLDALLHKATNAGLERPDPASLEAFCAVLGDSPNGAYIATRVIASRIRSPHPAEALLALEVLDSCMKRCDAAFHAEVDKFRFLNEMIKLVSPKYYGNKTAPAVRQKVLTLLHGWTVDYPREIKIKDAYEMLKKQGVVKETPPLPPPEVSTSASAVKPRSNDGIFQDEEKSKMLQKLLQSKNPDDLQAANRLIKTMVREEEHKVEAVTRRVTELQTIHNNARLLNEMLDHYSPSVSSHEDQELIKELHSECSRLRPTIFKLAAETQQNEENLNHILEISDELSRVFDKYIRIMISENAKTKSGNSINAVGNGSSLLDLAVPAGDRVSTASNNSNPEPKQSNFEALGDIFSSLVTHNETDKKSDVEDVPVLKPVSLINQPSGKEDQSNSKLDCQNKNKGFEELNALGEELLKSSLPPSCKSSTSQRSEKLPMNSIGKVTTPVAIENEKTVVLKENKTKKSQLQNEMLDLDFLISRTLKSEENTCLQSPTDDAMVDISLDEILVDTKAKTADDSSDISLIDYLKTLNVNDEAKSTNSKETDKISNGELNLTDKQKVNKEPKVNSDVKSLNDINITLDSIKPGNKSPLTIFEESDGLTVVLHFAKNKPRPDVTVVVISTTSRNALPISDYKFHAVVPKGCKVRLLQPSGECFPVFSPFLPPAAVTQVMLIARPMEESPSQILFKFVISYSCQDETFSEMGEVKLLDLNEM